MYPRLRRVLSPIPSAASTVLGLSSTRFQTLPIGTTIEVSPSSFKIARQIGELLSRPNNQSTEQHPELSPGGCGLIVDYGGEKVFGNSFRVCTITTFTVQSDCQCRPSRIIKSLIYSINQESVISPRMLISLFFARQWETLVFPPFTLLEELSLNDVPFSRYPWTYSPIYLSDTHGVAITRECACS
jgi:Putative S-adenosyl-L-methionine-dependent methyltransferase